LGGKTHAGMKKGGDDKDGEIVPSNFEKELPRERRGGNGSENKGR